MHPLLSSLTAATGGAPTHVETLPGVSAEFGDWPDWIDPAVAAAFGCVGVDRPWRHQVQALELLHAGKHLALATPTGSGKSLVAWAPALSAIRRQVSGRISARSRRATAIYLSPTKALAADQADALTTLIRAARLTGVNLATVDGDATATDRDWAQQWGDVILTNPDFVHHSLLPRHQRWHRLLYGLEFIIVDELHAYRGMTGAHVALVVRRLLRLARLAGARPQVIIASATTADPGATLATFLAADAGEIGVVTASTAPQGRRTIALWEPPPADAGGPTPDAGDPGLDSDEPADPSLVDPGPRKSALAEAADLLTALATADRRTLVFTRARAAAEAIAQMSQEQLPRRLRGKVAAYRGGFLPEERRELERDLRSGALLGLATTNALELGIDISGLDAVVMTGWPGTRASFWQQVGRAGRAGTDGFAVMVASPDPLDNYLLHHPAHLFASPIEASVFDPTNPNVLAPHLCAAAAEAPLTEADFEIFALPDAALLDELTARGLLRRRHRGWYWNLDRPEAPHTLTDLRGSGGQPVAVVEGSTGRMIGTVDPSRADATVHPGAVYIHQGHTFSVEDYDGEVAVVERSTLPFRTRAFDRTRVEVLQVDAEFTAGEVTWRYGSVEVQSQVTGFDRRQLPGLEVVGSYPLDLPEHHLRTKSVWWTIPTQVFTSIGIGAADLPGALHAAEHAMIALLGLVATCDRWDLGGLSTAFHEHSLAPTVFVHDAFPGGAGFARRGFETARVWVEATGAAVRDCPCEDGCPRCIQSPKCGNGNNPLDKAGAILTLAYLAESLRPAES